jgi:hypothetical protein
VRVYASVGRVQVPGLESSGVDERRASNRHDARLEMQIGQMAMRAALGGRGWILRGMYEQCGKDDVSSSSKAGRVLSMDDGSAYASPSYVGIGWRRPVSGRSEI